MSQSPQEAAGSRSYKEGWRAVNQLIREGGSWSGRERNVAYRNLGGGRFEDVSYVAGLDFSGDGRAWASFDYDLDGRMDLALSFRTGPRLRVLHNEHAGSEKSLQFALRGVKSNRDAVGAWVKLVTSTRTMHRQVRAGSGFLSESTRRVHFGLADGEKPVRLEIAWPSGAAQVFEQVPGSGVFQVVEGGQVSPFVAQRTVVPVAAERVEESLWLAAPVPLPEAVLAKGKLTLVSFYGDWCPPCRAELAEWKGQPLPLQVIDVDKTQMAGWNTFRRLLFDYREDLALPTSFLVDDRGRLLKVYRGATPAAAVLADLKAVARPALPFAGEWLVRPGERDYTEMATAMAEAGLLEQAGRYFALARPDVEMRVNYAALLLEQKQPGAAEAILRDVLRGDPNQPDALANLGLHYLDAERNEEAAGVLEKLRGLQRDDGAAAEWLGMARIGQGRLADAVGEFEAARKLGRESGDLLNHLAILYAETGRREEAIALFKYGVAKYPGHAGLAGNLRRLVP